MSLTIITGASSNHFRAFSNLLRSIRRYAPQARVVAYDLGLTPKQLSVVRTRCDILKRFDFENHPAWMNIALPSRGEYAWKPILFAEWVLESSTGIVLWLDAGNLVIGPLDELIAFVRREGFYSPSSHQTVARYTHPLTLDRLQGNDLGHRIALSGGLVGVDRENPHARTLIERWRDCALNRDIIAPLGSSRENHRQDQAVLTILAYQSQASAGWTLEDRILNVTTHNDRLPYLGSVGLSLVSRSQRLREIWRSRFLGGARGNEQRGHR